MIPSTHQTRFDPEDWQAFWNWEHLEDRFSKMAIVYTLCGVLGLCLIIGLFTDKVLAFAAVAASLVLGSAISIAFAVNRFVRKRLIKGAPEATYSLSGYQLGNRFLPWPSSAVAEISRVEKFDLPRFLVLQIEINTNGQRLNYLRLPFNIRDRELRNQYADMFEQKRGQKR